MAVAIAFLKKPPQDIHTADPLITNSRNAASRAICKLADKLSNEQKWSESV